MRGAFLEVRDVWWTFLIYTFFQYVAIELAGWETSKWSSSLKNFMTVFYLIILRIQENKNYRAHHKN